MGRRMIAVMLLLAGCSGERASPDAGVAEAREACRIFSNAMGELAGERFTPAQAKAEIDKAQTEAVKAQTANGRWSRLAGNLRFAGEAVGALDENRLRNEAQYLENGPATHAVDAVRDDCDQLDQELEQQQEQEQEPEPSA